MNFKLYKFDMYGQDLSYWIITPMREPPGMSMVYCASVVIECRNNEYNCLKNRFGHNNFIERNTLAKFMRMNHIDYLYLYNGEIDPCDIGRVEPEKIIDSLFRIPYNQIQESLNFQYNIEEHYEFQMHIRRSRQDRDFADRRKLFGDSNSSG